MQRTTGQYASPGPVTPPPHRAALIGVVLAILAGAGLIGLSARGWIGTTFPGFFVLSNRVVPSVGLPGWSGSDGGTIYQAVVVAVDGDPVRDNTDVYDRVARRPVGTPVRYTLRSGSSTLTVDLPSRTFSRADYWAIHGAYLGTGVLYLLLAVLAVWSFPGTHCGRALAAVGGIGGVYALSGVGLYGPGASMHLHVLAEASFPAAFVYLALCFPVERTALLRPGLALAVWLSAVLTVPYLLLLGAPGAYSTMHAVCESYLGLAGFVFTGSLIVHATWTSVGWHPLLGAATAGALLGLGVPAAVVGISGLSGGALPVNVMTVTAFLFPLCLAVGLVRHALAARRPLRAATVDTSG